MKQLIMGVYRIYDAKNPDGGSFIGFSRNVEGTLKRLRFELALNACPYKPLQEFYADCVKPELELYEEYAPGDETNDFILDAHLKARALAAKTRLGENVHLVQFIQSH